MERNMSAIIKEFQNLFRTLLSLHASRFTLHTSNLTFAIRHSSFVISLFFLLPAFSQSFDDKSATFFMGRIKYSGASAEKNEGNDCPGVGQDLMKLVSRASTLKVQEERKLRLTDPELFDTPFLFMNGHGEFVLTETEV